MVPPLATRATLAAWPLNGVNAVEPTNNLTSQSAAPFQADERGCLFICLFFYPIARSLIFQREIKQISIQVA